jgi:threonine dehydratase
LAVQMADLPGFSDVEAAAARLRGRAVHTPLLEIPRVNDRVGYRLLLKAECLQRTGSFKFRGAFNRLSALSEAERKRGVVAFSSGNHAQGVACAAQLLGIKAVIVMPADAPHIKIDNTRGYGAEVVLYDRHTESREGIADRLVAERGATLVRPFDDPLIIAGQGTAAIEAIADAAALGFAFDVMAAPTSGGGLIAGCALACEGLSPKTRVYTAEPAGLDDHARSLAAGHRVGHDAKTESICDALQAIMPGEVTFAVNRSRLAGGLTVTDDEAKNAMRVAFAEYKLVLEPSGAVALAAALQGRIPGLDGPGRAVCIIASGGNVDAEFYADVLRG